LLLERSFFFRSGIAIRSGGVFGINYVGVSFKVHIILTILCALVQNAYVSPKAPDLFKVRFETSKGSFEIEVHRDWAPNGADRFYDLVRSGYFDQSRFFRVVKDRWALFGINGTPATSRLWRERTFPDDPRRESNTRGMVAFAFAVPNGRTSQVYISLGDLSSQDSQGFAPFGKVVAGMDVVDSLYSGYGETSGGGIRAGKQAPLFEQGNAYLDREYPQLDKIIRAVVIPQ
jgi:homoserine O-acetyltransferase